MRGTGDEPFESVVGSERKYVEDDEPFSRKGERFKDFACLLRIATLEYKHDAVGVRERLLEGTSGVPHPDSMAATSRAMNASTTGLNTTGR